MAEKEKRNSRPAEDPEAREKQLTNLAYNLAEKQLMDGTASPSVIGHFLKIASKRESLEQDIMTSNKILLDAKAQEIFKDRETERVVKEAMEAMTKYRSSSE